MPRLIRSKYLETAETMYGLEKDLLTNSIVGFEPLRKINTYRLRSVDVARPDLVSMKLYGSSDYWWFLMKYNNIDDIWNEMYVNMKLDYPSSIDIINYLNGRN